MMFVKGISNKVCLPPYEKNSPQTGQFFSMLLMTRPINPSQLLIKEVEAQLIIGCCSTLQHNAPAKSHRFAEFIFILSKTFKPLG